MSSPVLNASPPLVSAAPRFLAVLGSLMTVGMLTLVSKGVSFGKEIVVAGHFGTRPELDAFILAYMIPGLVPMVFAGGMPDVLLPAYADLRERQGRGAADRLALSCLRNYALMLGGVMLVLAAAGHFIVPLLSGISDPAYQNLVEDMFLKLAPFGFLFGMSFPFAAWLQANKNFVTAALAPALIPLSIIVSVFAWPVDDVHSLVWGSVAGSALLLVVMAGTCLKQARPVADSPELKLETQRVFRESLPLLGGGLLMVGMPVVDQVMASHLPAGNLSALSYSERLCGVVLTLGAAVASQALFPYMADLAARREYAALKSTVLRYAGGIALVSLPVVGAAWVAAPQIVAAFFERGDFLPSDTVHVAEVLKYHALQIPFYISAVIASRVVLSLRASRFMLLTTCVSLPVNVILNYLLMSRMGAAGLALSTAGVYALSAVILYTWIFRRLKAAEPVSA